MAVLTTGLTVIQLFVPKVAGLADNGDFLRTLCHLHAGPDIGPGVPAKFAEVIVTYHAVPSAAGTHCKYQSPALTPLWIASQISRRLPNAHLLDLRLVALGYAVVFGVAVGTLAASLPGRARERLLATGVAVVVLADFCFTSYFVSAYSEPAGFVALVAVVGLCVAYWRAPTPSLRLLGAITVAGVVLVTAKPQYGPIAAVLAAALLVRPVVSRSVGRHLKAGPRRRGLGFLHSRWPALAAASVLIVAGTLAVTGAPSDLKKTDQYQMVFVEILPHSTTPAEDLRSLGLSPELARWVGSDSFEPVNATSDPAFDGFFAKTTPVAIGGFYLHHPGRAVLLVVRGMRASADPRVDYLGRSTSLRNGRPDTSLCRFCLYSSVGHFLKPAFPVLLPVLWTGVLALALLCGRSPRRDDRALAGAAAVVVAIAIVELLAALLGDGTYELVKHLYLADAANALGIILAIPMAASLRRNRRPALGRGGGDDEPRDPSALAG